MGKAHLQANADRPAGIPHPGPPDAAGTPFDVAAIGAGLFVQAVVFWAVVSQLDAAAVTGHAWVGLHAFTAAALAALDPRARWPARRWIATLFYAVFLAGIFFGLNVGLDILHGAARPKADAARHLGGLEFWFFLCPGVAALAAGGLARRLLTAGRRERRAA